jgi:class 3 adenylate cyclase
MLGRLVHEAAPRCTRASMRCTRAGARTGGGTAAERGGRTRIGLSFGPATIGFGPAGKKQFGVIGEPVNLAAFLCSQAYAGSLLVDRDSFVRAGATPA